MAIMPQNTPPELIEGIYDAALKPARWNDVVVGIRDFVGGQACGLFSKDRISRFGVTHYYCGADPHYIEMYSETYSRFDPLTTLPRCGEVVSIPDLVDFDKYRRGRFYQEWLKPQGCIDAANVVLESSNCPVLMTVLVGKRMVSEEMRRRIARIVPHANRALMINRALEAKRSEAAGLAAVLDGLNAGIFLIDAVCRIVHANAAGHRMLEADDVLREIGGQLFARDSSANRTLRRIFGVENGAASSAADAAFPLVAHDGERYVAHVLPLESVMWSGGKSFGAVGALFVRKVQMSGQSSGNLLAQTFDLTPAELRVLLAIVDVGGVPETAQALRIAETTVKTHLKRVFAKTGASRQADLIKLTTGFATPLANQAKAH
jgi:DNA-binding CsgD family transcriptional regulator/PAS domain-containing protein